MHLNEEQAKRFTVTANSLLDYASDRLHLASPLPPSPTLFDRAGHYHVLWKEICNSPDIIDRFVADNPDGLPQSYLNTALQWKDALRGHFDLVGYVRGQAILLHESSPYCVMGVSHEARDFIGEGPRRILTVLVPMDDRIVFADAVIEVRRFGAVETKRLQKQLAQRRSREGMSKNADSFVERVHAYKEAKAKEDAAQHECMEAALREQPEGYHRSPILDMSAEEASERIKAFLDEPTLEDYFQIMDPTMNGELAAHVAGPVLMLARSACLQRGLVPLAELYQHYLRLCTNNPLPEQEFQAVVRFGSEDCMLQYDMWEDDNGTEFVAFAGLTPRGVVFEFMSRHTDECSSDEEFNELLKRSLPSIRERVAEVERRRNEVLATFQSSGRSPRRMTRTMLECRNVVGWIEKIPEVRRLLQFLLEHTPNDRDDAYAYLLMDVVVSLGITSEEGFYDVIDTLRDAGMDAYCKDAAREEIFSRIVINALNALPSWDNLGWSRREVTERLMGRRIFYNPDGTEMRLGPEDPCPCGSGRSYGECCGKVAAA